eukprot:TRINITY_DN14562_c0_g1_i2.p1 TRINITY_DN14562_c0_g1~~TRINITY_DN14562_c0_g1_i2.p1  ORF type:complete len:312 (-),score=73.18 TRINITY_DN14562_c0_g1_i2:660-1595(-)
MKIFIISRSGREIVPGGLEVSDDATLEELQWALYKYNKKWSPPRQRFTLPLEPGQKKAVAVEAGKKLSAVLQGQANQLVFKDLGPQIGYRAVFFWEYFGPLALYPLFYLFPGFFYPWAQAQGEAEGPVRHPVQTLALAYWSLHYAKRIAETFLVHRFSHATMPVANLFRNCSYYWAFGAFVSYFVNHPLYTPVPLPRAQAALAVGLLCQAANLYCHIILRNLRSSSGGYQIPRGFLFEYCTCANYFAEICGWIAFNVATQTVAGTLFLLAGGYQMTVWAIAKHARLRKIFDGKDGRAKYPRGRWVVFPPFF